MKKRFTIIATLLACVNIGFAQVKVLSNGYVGVGTTSPITKFQIGDIFTFYDGGGDKEICRNARWANDSYWRIKTGVSSLVSFTGSGDILFKTAPSGTSGTAITNWSNVIIKSNGYVGLGTISPTKRLQVYGETLLDAYNTGNWGSAIRVKTYQPSACAYHLTYNNADVFYVCSQGYAWAKENYYLGSDIAFKENIKPLESSLNKVLRLNGVQYQLKEREKESADKFQIGFIAQEVEKIFPEVVKTMHDGTKAMSYINLTAVLVEAIKEQQVLIETLQKEVKSLQPTGTLKSTEISAMQELSLSDNAEKETLRLYQNAPNPFNERTTIKCYVPQVLQKVQLCVYNMQGVQVQCLNVTERGNIELHIEASALSSGVYNYILIADSIASETKQMILTK